MFDDEGIDLVIKQFSWRQRVHIFKTIFYSYKVSLKASMYKKQN